MRLLKPYSHTSEGRGYEADKKRKKKRKKARKSTYNAQEKRQRKPPPYHLQGGRGENVSTETRKTEAALQP